MKRLLFLCTLLLPGYAVSGQGNVSIYTPPAVDQLMNQFVEANKATPFVEGWRIQLMATTDRKRMEYSLQQFRSLYPSISIDWVHVAPYYKLQAGAFSSKLAAMRILYVIRRDYPGAYPIIDKSIKREALLYGG